MNPWGEGAEALSLTARDGTRLRAARMAPADEGAARGLVLLLPGRTEFLEKYAPVALAFAGRGFAVAALDWRGQGASARALPNPRKGHVGAFEEYQRDLDALAAAVADAPGPRVVAAHSMGGLVALRALARGLEASAAVFSAPMWGLAQPAPTAALGRSLSLAARRLGFGARYALGHGDAPYPLSGFAGNRLTACAEGFAHIEAVTRAWPDHALGGPTWGWVRAAYDEMAAARRLPLATPALVLAGALDRIVAAAPMRARAARGEARLVSLEGARHEPFFETAAVRERVWREIDAYLGERGV